MVIYSSVKNKHFTNCVVCGVVHTLQQCVLFLSICCRTHGTCVCRVTYARKMSSAYPVQICVDPTNV